MFGKNKELFIRIGLTIIGVVVLMLAFYYFTFLIEKKDIAKEIIETYDLESFKLKRYAVMKDYNLRVSQIKPFTNNIHFIQVLFFNTLLSISLFRPFTFNFRKEKKK